MMWRLCLAGTIAMTGHAALAIDDNGRNLMKAAAITLSYLTFPVKEPRMFDSTSEVRAADGTLFEWIDECVYALQEGSGPRGHVEIVKFKALTGEYQYAPSLAGVDLVFRGRDAKTRCYRIDGRSYCSADLKFSSIGRGDVQRIVDDIAYIHSHGCPPAEAEPY